jgi:hypothetical protein
MILDFKPENRVREKYKKNKQTNKQKQPNYYIKIAGVWIRFSRHSPNWRAVRNVHSPTQKTTGPKYRKGK